MNNTNTVQSFVRGLIFLIAFTVLFIFVGLPIYSVVSSVLGLEMPVLGVILVANLWISNVISSMFYVLPEWQKMVVLRLGRFDGVRGAGFFIIPPFIYSIAAIVDSRIETQQVEATATLTKDNVPTKVTAAVEFRVEDAKKAVIDVQNFKSSVIWLSTEALKNTIGSMDLKELLSERDEIAASLKEQIDTGAAAYGVDVKAVRITDIDTPQSLVEELAVIARARRASEAKKIEAEAEVMVAEKIAEASKILGKSKESLRLRELQVLSDISKEESSMVIIYPYGDRNGQEIANSASSNFLKPNTLEADDTQMDEK